jgi:hypothetical protein
MLRLLVILAALLTACGSEDDDRNPRCTSPAPAAAPCVEVRPGEFECPC